MTDEQWAEREAEWEVWKKEMLKPGVKMEKPLREVVELSDRWDEQNELYILAMRNCDKVAAMRAVDKRDEILHKINILESNEREATQ
ncbi:hypothetical protein LCGC14_2051800 [marine sediment metagenome]|uniref:Uncharacterized protein n=1 Tax=marine sediment metagenome TaxID=412755 RepID=A0A0F9ENV0_9ZZZZ